jgi:hypothetical protein
MHFSRIGVQNNYKTKIYKFNKGKNSQLHGAWVTFNPSKPKLLEDMQQNLSSSDCLPIDEN